MGSRLDGGFTPLPKSPVGAARPLPTGAGYALLWGERQLVSVANLTRGDVETFFRVAQKARVRTTTTVYRLEDANAALDDMRLGRLQGAAVLVP